MARTAALEGDLRDRLDDQIKRQARLMAALTSRPMQSTRDLAGWLQAVYRTDPASRHHCERVAASAVRIGAEMSLGADALADLERAALVHDLGRWATADARRDSSAILPGSARDRLDQARVAGDILSIVPLLEPAAALIAASFEWYDGSGYPQGLSARAIPLGARVLAVADAADTLAVLCLALHHPFDMVRDELIRSAGTRFDPEVVAVWLQASDRDAQSVSIWGASLPTLH
jgi:response regulator RpfG family c-di-GMP phosphodiesterase